LVMDMLTFGKERQPVLQCGDLNATVAEVFELLQPRANEFNVRFECCPSPDLPRLTFDAEGIHRAVLNIMGNALDAVEGREGAAVRVATGVNPQTGTVAVTVSDNGPGIASELLPHIFNIFE